MKGAPGRTANRLWVAAQPTYRRTHHTPSRHSRCLRSCVASSEGSNRPETLHCLSVPANLATKVPCGIRLRRNRCRAPLCPRVGEAGRRIRGSPTRCRQPEGGGNVVLARWRSGDCWSAGRPRPGSKDPAAAGRPRSGRPSFRRGPRSVRRPDRRHDRGVRAGGSGRFDRHGSVRSDGCPPPSRWEALPHASRKRRHGEGFLRSNPSVAGRGKCPDARINYGGDDDTEDRAPVVPPWKAPAPLVRARIVHSPRVPVSTGVPAVLRAIQNG
jgi:hypothetical protein